MSKNKNNEKYLIAANLDKEYDLIKEINEHFIAKINAIASAINAFGIMPTKPLVLSALANPDNIIDMYHRAQELADNERRKTMGDDQFNAMKSAMSDLAGEKERHDAKLVKNLCAACNEIKNGTYYFHDGKRIDDPKRMAWFEMGDDGCAFIPDAVKESIHDGCCKYINTAAGKELRDLQCDIAAKLEKMYYIMQTMDNARKTCLDFDAKGAFFNFPGALFEYKDENGFMRITPRALNFDPVDRDSVY